MQYFAYLLRVWQTTDATGATVWRASLQHADETTRLNFPDMETLFTFLAAQCEPPRVGSETIPPADM